MRHKGLLLAGTALLTAGPVFAQTPAATPTAPTAAPAVAAPAPQAADVPAADSGEVLVVAERGVQQSIDRKSYTVRQGPAAEASTGIDAIRDLPAVSVDAAGRIELLGSGNVKILIDGRPVPDALTILRGLSAAQIARIEVVTNPSAQFPSDGTAGVINVITRRTSRDGLSGSLAGGIDSRGALQLRAGPSWTKDKWTVSTNLGRFAQRQPSRSRIERQQLAGAPDGVTNRNEASELEQRGRGLFVHSQAIYRPDARRNLSAAFSASRFSGDQDSVNAVTPGLGGAGFVPFEQAGRYRQQVSAGNLALDYRLTGRRPTENLVVAGSASTFTFVNNGSFRDTAANGATADLLVGTRVEDRSATLKLDYATPRGADRLSIGGQLDWRDRELADFARGSGLLGAPRNSASAFGGSYVEGAAYVTYQTMLGQWKLLPGLRVQARDYALDGGGGLSRVAPFPSLHIERALSTRFIGVLSYSRRIAWPDIGDLTPIVRQVSPTFAVSGNPALDPETTDAIEARLSYGGRVHSADITLYNRITYDTFDRRIDQSGDGLLISRPVNAGRRVDQGAEFVLRGRIAAPLRYALTGNLTSVSRIVDLAGTRERNAQYRGKLQLDYIDGKAGDPGYDQITFNLRYEGPVQNFQTRRSDYVDADVQWTHRFTRRLSSVVSVASLFDGYTVETRLRTPFLLERRFDRTPGTTARFTLTYQLGNNPQPLPPPQAVPQALPIPGQ